MKKPDVAAIRAAVPLSRRPERGQDPIRVCNVCGVAVDPKDLYLTVWREHDEADRPIAGDGALIFLGSGTVHEACRKTLEAHPRLYAEVSGTPGNFPWLCGPCVHRQERRCTHPSTKANGGAGIAITLSGLNGIICTRGRGCITPTKNAVACAERVERKGAPGA